MGLDETKILALWERGVGLHALDRALLLAAAAQPGVAGDELAALPLGRRDRLVLALRRHAFGPRLPVLTRCPHCDEPLEFELDAEALSAETDGGAAETEFELELEGMTLRLHLPDSFDLAAAAQCADVAAACTCLLRRCVLSAQGSQGPVALDGLSAAQLAAVGEALLSADPGAELRLALSCPACAQTWYGWLDPVAYAWTEFAHQARQALGDVHALASAYGWSEGQILALSPARRAAYLAQVVA